MTFHKQDTEERLKLPNLYAEHISGQNYVMKLKDMSKTVIHVTGLNQSDMRRTASYNP